MSSNHVRLSVLGLGISLGIVWAVAMLITGIGATYFDYGNQFVEMFGSIYMGYEASLVGSLIGCAWGFVDAFVGGVIIALVYNGVTCCLSGCCKKN